MWSYGQAESKHGLPGRPLSKEQQGQREKQFAWKGRNQIIKTTVLLKLCKVPLVKLQTLPSGKIAHVNLRLCVTTLQCDQGMFIQIAQLESEKGYNIIFAKLLLNQMCFNTSLLLDQRITASLSTATLCYCKSVLYPDTSFLLNFQ